MTFATLPGIQLQWTAYVAAGGDTFVQYNIYRRIRGYLAWTRIAVLPAQSQVRWTDYTVASAVTYQYVVTATITRSGIAIESPLPANLVGNPGFEVDTSGWDTASSFYLNPGAALIRDPTTAFEGAASGSFITDGVHTFEGIRYTALPSLTNGTNYTLSLEMTGTPGVTLEAVLGDSAGADTTLDTTMTSSWLRMSLAWTATANPAFVALRIPAAVIASVNIDNVEVLPTSTVPAARSCTFSSLFLHDVAAPLYYLEWRGNAAKVDRYQAQVFSSGWNRQKPTLYIGEADSMHYQLTATNQVPVSNVELWTAIKALMDRQRNNGSVFQYRNAVTGDAAFVGISAEQRRAGQSGSGGMLPVQRQDALTHNIPTLDLIETAYVQAV